MTAVNPMSFGQTDLRRTLMSAFSLGLAEGGPIVKLVHEVPNDTKELAEPVLHAIAAFGDTHRDQLLTFVDKQNLDDSPSERQAQMTSDIVHVLYKAEGVWKSLLDELFTAINHVFISFRAVLLLIAIRATAPQFEPIAA